MLDVEPGELRGELLEAVIVGDVFAQGGSFGGRHAPGVVAAVLPDLEFVIRTEADGHFAVGRGPLEVLLESVPRCISVRTESCSRTASRVVVPVGVFIAPELTYEPRNRQADIAQSPQGRFDFFVMHPLARAAQFSG